MDGKIKDTTEHLCVQLILACRYNRLREFFKDRDECFSQAHDTLRALKRAVDGSEDETQKAELIQFIRSTFRNAWYGRMIPVRLSDAEIADFPQHCASRLAPEWSQLFGDR